MYHAGDRLTEKQTDKDIDRQGLIHVCNWILTSCQPHRDYLRMNRERERGEREREVGEREREEFRGRLLTGF